MSEIRREHPGMSPEEQEAFEQAATAESREKRPSFSRPFDNEQSRSAVPEFMPGSKPKEKIPDLSATESDIEGLSAEELKKIEDNPEAWLNQAIGRTDLTPHEQLVGSIKAQEVISDRGEKAA